MNLSLLTLAIKQEMDVVTARQRSRQTAGLLGFDAQNQVRIATAVSEIARNALDYAGGGKIEIGVEVEDSSQSMMIQITDRGSGIRDLDAVLEGRYASSGTGIGIIGARRLIDHFAIDSRPGEGTTVVLKKLLPKTAALIDRSRLRSITDQLAVQQPGSAFHEVQQLNLELMRLLDELRQRQDELARINRELEDTNRGVVALYAELDEKAGHLRRADQTKSSFLSHMSHELRTPLNSILALSQLLLDRADGDLTSEQEKQVLFIHKGAAWLLEMVNDLLDLAKIEAGKTEVHADLFTVENLFSALRGVFRPLLSERNVKLVFEEVHDLPSLHTDEGKVSQILRNFLSNALKFTEHGEVRVRAELLPGAESISFAVTDTGVGIAPENQSRIFDEYAQIDNPLQRRVKGTGLGLPLCRKLATLLGGSVSIASELGAGSTFTVTIPVKFEEARQDVKRAVANEPADHASKTAGADADVLIIDDDATSRYLIRKLLSDSPYRVREAAGGIEGIRLARDTKPQLILLDLNMPEPAGPEVISRLRSDPSTEKIPIVIVTTQVLSAEERDRLRDQTSGILNKDSLTSDAIVEAVEQAIGAAG